MSDLSIVEVTRLREALIAMGRQIPGCVLHDDAQTDFLMLLPEEMRLWKERTASEAERVREACAKVARECVLQSADRSRDGGLERGWRPHRRCYPFPSDRWGGVMTMPSARALAYGRANKLSRRFALRSLSRMEVT
jgi:hypothetical protein